MRPRARPGPGRRRRLSREVRAGPSAALEGAAAPGGAAGARPQGRRPPPALVFLGFRGLRGARPGLAPGAAGRGSRGVQALAGAALALRGGCWAASRGPRLAPERPVPREAAAAARLRLRLAPARWLGRPPGKPPRGVRRSSSALPGAGCVRSRLRALPLRPSAGTRMQKAVGTVLCFYD